MKDPQNEKELERIRKRAEELRRIRSEQPRLSSSEINRRLKAAATLAGIKHPIRYPETRQQAVIGIPDAGVDLVSPAAPGIAGCMALVLNSVLKKPPLPGETDLTP